MRISSHLILLALISGLIAATGIPSWASGTSCVVCHNAMSGTGTTPAGVEVQLGIDLERFQSSVHSFMTCTECHMKFDENPHVTPTEKVPEAVVQLADSIQTKAVIDPVAYSACSTCHPEIYSQVIASVHGKNITEKGQSDGALCLDCHGSPHYIASMKSPDSPVNHGTVVETCGHCHGSAELQAKYELEPNVMEGYKESFHGRKHHLGHKRAPSCASCHGAHDIRSADDPESPVHGSANKITLCGKCHPGANEKFVVSYTHKPVGPIPHYAEKALIILLISTIAFTIVHVILEAYSDIRDTVFRKGGTTHHE